MTRKALSRYWASGHHAVMGRTTDKARRLAIALGAVKSIIRVVDRHMPPLSVDWSSIDDSAPIKSMSYTDLRGGSIHINPMPILDEALGHGEALDVAIGFGLHEASHSQESRDRFEHLLKKEMHPNGKAMREVPAFAPMRIAGYLWNLVEDVRIERATSRNWPGFAPYFGAVLDYMWSEMRRRGDQPTEYGPDLTGKLKVVFVACRYPSRMVGYLADDELRKEIEWWQAWQDDYLSDRADTPTTIKRGLDHLAEDPETAGEMREQAEAEKKEREAGERLRDQLERLMREGAGAPMCVIADGEAIPLDQETSEAVRQLVREGLIEVKTVVRSVGAGNPPLLVRKPEEDSYSRRAYVGRPDATAEALRAALVFRASAPQHNEKLLSTGEIDDEELYRWGAGDFRVFGQRVIESKPDVFMGLLVDLSGSMHGEKLDIAQRLAQLFVWAVHDQEGIQTQVWGHTTEGEASSVFRLWEQGDPLTRLGLIQTIDHDSNADGHAIAYVASEIAKAEQPEKVLVVLADGLPAHSNYGGEPAFQHIRSVQRWAMSRGVRVIQVAIDPHGIRPEEQAKMFGTEGEGWIGFKDYAALPRQITNLMSRFI